MNKADDLGDRIENLFVNFAARVGPWSASVFPAFITGYHLYYGLGFPLWLSIISAFSVGVLGLASIRTGLVFWNHNRRYTDEKKHVPLGIPVTAFIIYLTIVVVMNALMEIWPESLIVRVTTITLLAFLEVPAAFLLGVRALLTDIELRIEEDNEKRREAAAKRRAEKKEQKKIEKQREAEAIENAYGDMGVKDRVIEFLAANDLTPFDIGASPAPLSPAKLAKEIGAKAGSVRVTISRLQDELESRGVTGD